MKQLIITIIFCVLVFGVRAQEVESVFVSMPDQYIPQLESAWKKDIIDLYNSGKEAQLKNTMNGTSTLQKMTSDYLFLEVTSRSTVEMKLLPLVNNTKVVCLVTTVNGPVPDSQIAFFTTEWEPLNTSDLYTPVPADWFIKEDADKNSVSFIEAMTRLDMNMQKISLSPDNQTLTVEYTTPRYLGTEDRNMVAPFLKKEPKVLAWEKFHFK